MHSSQYSYSQYGPPQPHQQTTSSTQLFWNGAQWLQSITPSAPPSFPLPPSTAPPPPLLQPLIIKHGKTHAELVQYYTQYYHNWNEQANQAKIVLASLPPPHPNTPTNNERRAEEERKEKWASYYAGNSAALAHYHLALSNSGAGGGEGLEPYARPSSPPLPPQMVAATRVGNGGDGGGQMANIIGTSAPTTINATPATTTKKKKKWAVATEDTIAATNITTRTLQQLEEEAIRRTTTAGGVGNYNNKINGKSTNSSSNSSYLAAVLPGVGSTVGSSLYNKFVQEQASPSFGGAGAGCESGMKRKFMSNDVDDFSFGKSGNNSNIGGGGGGSYYGPSSSSSLKDDDYVPLSLDQPLGYAKKQQQQQNNKKKKMKKTNILSLNNNMLGFNADETALSDRARRFQGKGGIDSAANAPTTIANVEKYMGKTIIGGSMKQLDENDYERMTVKGLCTILEKEYLRLTSPPKAELVRPQHILEEHLLQLKQSYYCLNSKKGKSGNDDRVHNGRIRDYSWYCSQLKAIRQDLTVQRIINAFAVDVYETHAKMALEEDDINEYNQSQTQLKELYDLIDRRRQKRANDGTSSSEKLKEVNCKTKKKVSKKKCGGGKNKCNNVVVGGDDGDMTTTGSVDDDTALQNQNEFIAYRIIYYVFLTGNKKYEGGSSDIFKIMLELTNQQREDVSIYHALMVRAAVADNNYHQFFHLQDIAPNMGDYLMDKMIPSIRQGALQRICKAYRPSVPVNFVLKELGFDVSDKAEVWGGLAWMKSCGCLFDGELLNSKDTVLTESTAVGTKKSSLI